MKALTLEQAVGVKMGELYFLIKPTKTSLPQENIRLREIFHIV